MWGVHVQRHRDGEEAEGGYESMINSRGVHGTNHDADRDRMSSKMKWKNDDK